jgi:hypothetical protein
VDKAEAELRRQAELHPNISALTLNVFKAHQQMMAQPVHSDDEEVRTSCLTCLITTFHSAFH